MRKPGPKPIVPTFFATSSRHARHCCRADVGTTRCRLRYTPRHNAAVFDSEIKQRALDRSWIISTGYKKLLTWKRYCNEYAGDDDAAGRQTR